MTQAEVDRMVDENLAKLAKIPPEQRYQDMIDTGLINKQGELTTWFGGDAEPEPGAKRPKGYFD